VLEFALYSVTVLTYSCTNYRTDTHYWTEISSLQRQVYCVNQLKVFRYAIIIKQTSKATIL